jgi:hypothetical protein
MIPSFVESQRFIAVGKCTIHEHIKILHNEDSCVLQCYCRLLTFVGISEKRALYVYLQ